MRTSRALAPTQRAAALLLGLLTGLLLVLVGVDPAGAAAPAATQGSLCTGAGVNVVVDPHQLGGPTTLACDEQGAGRTASQVFADAGVRITPVTSFPGAACRVDGQPAGGGCAKMPPADAYWGLYVRKGSTWTYAPKGVDELEVADGDFLAFSWQGTKSSTPPSVAPVRPTASPSASPSSGPATSPATRDEQSQDGGGVAWWVPALVVVLLVVAGAVVLVRRRGRAGL